MSRAKRCSPIAATAWQESAGHRQPRVHVYFINEENLLRERIWDPMLHWTDGTLNALNIDVSPSSQLSATSWGDGNIMLCYQGNDDVIHVLDGWAHDAVWKIGATIEEADSDSPLAVTNFEHLGFRAARLYFKLNGIIREACWDEVRDDVRAPPRYYLGECHKESSDKASISALAWKSESLEMRLYLSSGNILHDTRYSGGWLDFNISGHGDGHITAVRWASGVVHIFSIERTGLTQVTDYEFRTKKHILTRAGCDCSPFSHLQDPEISPPNIPGSETSSRESSIQPYQSSLTTTDTSLHSIAAEPPRPTGRARSPSSMQGFKQFFWGGCCTAKRRRRPQSPQVARPRPQPTRPPSPSPSRPTRPPSPSPRPRLPQPRPPSPSPSRPARRHQVRPVTALNSEPQLRYPARPVPSPVNSTPEVHYPTIERWERETQEGT
ncbi:hypothetical protein J3F84DRAFT_74083 [Trichoderma pleuroticola]